VVVQRSS